MKKTILKTKETMRNLAGNVFYVLSGLLVSSVCWADEASTATAHLKTIFTAWVGPYSPGHYFLCAAAAFAAAVKFKFKSDWAAIGIFLGLLVVYPYVWDMLDRSFS